MSLTESEIAVLTTIKYNYFQPDNGEGIEFDGSIWSDCLNDSGRPSGITGKALSGVVSNLAQKGLVEADDESKDSTLWLTEKGVETVKNF